VIFAFPAATAVPKPLLSTVATAVLDDLQATCVVISLVVPSEYVPKAVNCPLTSAGTFGLPGVTDIETSSAVDHPEPALDDPESEPLPPPHPAKIKRGTNKGRKIKSFAFIRYLP